MVSDRVFSFMELYIFFFIALTAFCALGLNELVTVTNPAFAAPTFTTFEVSGEWTDIVVIIVNALIWFFENIAFLFSLIFANPFTGAAWLGYMFTFLSTMFGLCIVLIVRD